MTPRSYVPTWADYTFGRWELEHRSGDDDWQIRLCVSNGRHPRIGLGTADGERRGWCRELCHQDGLSPHRWRGYLHNERSVGKGWPSIRGGISREEPFVTSKLWNTERGYDRPWMPLRRPLLTSLTISTFTSSIGQAAHQFDDWAGDQPHTWRAFEKPLP